MSNNDNKSIEQQIKELVLSLGADVCGISNIDRFQETPVGFSPVDLWKSCKSVISFGVALPRGIMEVNPRLIYGHFNSISCVQVDQIAFQTAKELEERFGSKAVPLPCDAPNEYWDAPNLTARGLLSMKHTAILCGLGQFGKSTLLLNPKYGNQLTIGAVLTDLDLTSDDFSKNICLEKCTRCVDACPVHAIQDGSVKQKQCRINTYGKTARGFDTVDCNQCRMVCPMKFGEGKE
ncbi:epoxyqueuosine reductase [Anaerosporobacter faecicola]|uniref:epoxyqueuosine reductase n=1 Tax=Anaerosporobacter faecicola TaxID=2718714 RepID=UPI001EE4EC17|nr:epoxyqueuosine reductase [Anaerosporobacter faecicola]